MWRTRIRPISTTREKADDPPRAPRLLKGSLIMLAAARMEETESSPITIRVPHFVVPPEAKREGEEGPYLAVTVRSVEVARAGGIGGRAVAVIGSMAFVVLGIIGALFLWGR